MRRYKNNSYKTVEVIGKHLIDLYEGTWFRGFPDLDTKTICAAFL